jgi:hypothetical protein
MATVLQSATYAFIERIERPSPVGSSANLNLDLHPPTGRYPMATLGRPSS